MVNSNDKQKTDAPDQITSHRRKTSPPVPRGGRLRAHAFGENPEGAPRNTPAGHTTTKQRAGVPQKHTAPGHGSHDRTRDPGCTPSGPAQDVHQGAPRAAQGAENSRASPPKIRSAPPRLSAAQIKRITKALHLTHNISQQKGIHPQDTPPCIRKKDTDAYWSHHATNRTVESKQITTERQQ